MNEVNVLPRGEYLLVKLSSGADQTKSGIYLPNSSKEAPNRGVIVGKGPGKKENGELCPIELELGEEVMFNKFIGVEVDVLDTESKYKLVKESEILATIKRVDDDIA